MNHSLLLLSGMLLSASALAQTSSERPSDSRTFTIDSPEVRASIRKEWKGSPDLPDGIAFVQQARLLQTAVAAAGDAQDASFHFRVQLGVTEDEGAKIYEQMLLGLKAYETETDAMTYSSACERGAPRAFNEDAYNVLESIDDAREGIAEKAYRSAIAELPAHVATAFSRWLQDQKKNLTYTKFDYAKFDQATGRNQSVTLAQICNSRSDLR